MDATPRARTWRVSLADGQSTEVTGAKVVVTDCGALMALDDIRAAHAIRIFAAGSWLDCTEVTA